MMNEGHAQAPNWTGFYIGATAGGAFGRVAPRTTTVATSDPTSYFTDPDLPVIAAAGAQGARSSGFTGGIGLGYNLQIGAVILGLETDLQLFGQDFAAAGSGIYPCCAPTGFTIQSRVETNWLWTLRPRIGLLAAPNLLVYGTGGLAATDLDARFTFTDDFDAALATGAISSRKFGTVIGAGVEYAFNPNWSIKAEYLHVNFGRESMTTSNLVTSTASDWTSPFTYSTNLRSDIVRVGVNFRF